tara:strand:- start:2290 stop:3000 length:711 start_codon:yes stop_codon:yes gene_type:complete
MKDLPYEWVDRSKIEVLNKTYLIFLAVTLIIVGIISFLLRRTLSYVFLEFSEGTAIILVFAFIFLVIIVGSYLTFKFRYSKDSDDFRLALDSNSIIFLSEKEGNKMGNILIKNLDGIYFDAWNRYCYFARNKTESKLIMKAYTPHINKMQTHRKIQFLSGFTGKGSIGAASSLVTAYMEGTIYQTLKGKVYGSKVVNVKELIEKFNVLLGFDQYKNLISGQLLYRFRNFFYQYTKK